MKYTMIETAFDNVEELNKTISTLLEKKLVASCQVIESNSSWNWQGSLEKQKEYILLMKTKNSLLKEVYETIKTIHSYDCFEFACFDLNSCNIDYLNWIDTETK